MGKYGLAAVKAAGFIEQGIESNPVLAWERAVEFVFPQSPSSQKKGCPKGAFLGLCENGRVRHIPAGSYTNSYKNKTYALDALGILKSSIVVKDCHHLWQLIPKDDDSKKHNQQMDVVMSLFANGLTQ